MEDLANCFGCKEKWWIENMYPCYNCSKMYCDGCYHLKCVSFGCEYITGGQRSCDECLDKNFRYCIEKDCDCSNQVPANIDKKLYKKNHKKLRSQKLKKLYGKVWIREKILEN